MYRIITSKIRSFLSYLLSMIKVEVDFYLKDNNQSSFLRRDKLSGIPINGQKIELFVDEQIGLYVVVDVIHATGTRKNRIYVEHA